jgi:hemoglobin
MANGSIYERAGGEGAFFALVDRFYHGVENDPVLRPMYPRDLGPGKRHLALFLIQVFGGPKVYHQERGLPALPVRHHPFEIDRTARDHWVEHMTAAVEASPFAGDVRAELLAYFDRAATALINYPRTGLELRGMPMRRPPLS